MKSTYTLYTVKTSCYSTREVTVGFLCFQHIWKSPAPSNVCAFSWQLLFDRIPSKVNLSRRRVISQSEPLHCLMCGLTLETTTHLFLQCDFFYEIWSAVRSCNFILPPNFFAFFAIFVGFGKSNKTRKGLKLIWHAVLWSI